MRKVTETTVRAFLNGTKKKVGNTSTDGTRLMLHGNVIAKKVNDKILITDAGWQSPTTKERLNGLLDILGKTRIHQKDFVWYRGQEVFENGFNIA